MMLAVVLSLAIGAAAHNWVNCPSRSEFASTVNPALPSQTGLPHVRVAADQDFQVEWVNGHDSDCYWVLMPEKDHMKTLVKMNTAALEDYINSGPEAQKVSPPLRWQKYHRKYNSPNLDNKAGDAFFLKVTRPQDNDPNFMMRPVPWEGSLSGANTKATNFNVSLVFQSYYHQNSSCAMNDRRVQYTNPKYPAIIAVHRYRLCTGQGGRPDVARLTLPAGTPPGRYVAWWSWRGYYDIVDVEVGAGGPVALPYGVKVPPPPAGVPAQYKRVDHCAWPDATPAGKCFRIMTDARACLDMCDRLTEFACQGVGVVPVVYPASAYPGFKNVSLVPYEFAASCNKGNIERGANANHLLCFAAAARQKTETLDRMYITNDPDDPAFYSTCLIRIPFKDAAAGVVAAPPREPDFQFGKKCISCDQAQVSTVERQLMIWNITTNCSNCDVDGPKQPNPALVMPEFDQKAVPWLLRTNGNYCYGINQGSNFSANYNCPNTTVNCMIGLVPPGTGNLDVSEYDCYLLAKNNPECGTHAFFRPKGHPDGAFCWCWKHGSSNPAFECCGPCDSRNGGNRGNSTNWVLAKVK